MDCDLQEKISNQTTSLLANFAVTFNSHMARRGFSCCKTPVFSYQSPAICNAGSHPRTPPTNREKDTSCKAAVASSAVYDPFLVLEAMICSLTCA
jgi:hypothetical protein